MGTENCFESSPEMEKLLCEKLLDQQQPISERFRSLFSLRNLRGPAPRRALMIVGVYVSGLVLWWEITDQETDES
ncbi:uncharacterized protein A4U43_C07F4930 [Asparagus officinalis]|uniref:Uncharacterized protein n=1 Tax=Asparagus officinalis TaxID=4686 RepID=A0A5P1EEN6_ASPOF|nr:uncharacterized protein A4U43_C07F4930 [Asparagus officinalis]